MQTYLITYIYGGRVFHYRTHSYYSAAQAEEAFLAENPDADIQRIEPYLEATEK